MTEYDYSPEGYARARATEARIRNWRDRTELSAPLFGNPLMLTPSEQHERSRATSPDSSESSLVDSTTDDYYGDTAGRTERRGRGRRGSAAHRSQHQGSYFPAASRDKENRGRAALKHSRSRSLSYACPPPHHNTHYTNAPVYAPAPLPIPPPPHLHPHGGAYQKPYQPSRSITVPTYVGHPIYAPTPNTTPHCSPPHSASHHAANAARHNTSPPPPMMQQYHAFPPHMRASMQPHRSNSVPNAGAGTGVHVTHHHHPTQYPQHQQQQHQPQVVYSGSRGIQVVTHAPQPRYPYPAVQSKQQPWFKRIFGGGASNASGSRKSHRSRRQSY